MHAKLSKHLPVEFFLISALDDRNSSNFEPYIILSPSLDLLFRFKSSFQEEFGDTFNGSVS